MNPLSYYINYLLSEFEGYPFIIRMAVVFVMVLIAVCLLALVRIFYIGYKKRKEVRYKKRIEKEYGEGLREILYTTENLNEGDLDEKYHLKIPAKKWEKKYLTELILDIRKNAPPSGTEKKRQFNKNNYHLVLKYTELYNYWESRLTSGNTNRMITSLRTLDNIGEGVSGAAMARSVYHREDYLRKYARSTFTRFDVHESFKFLEEDFDQRFNKFDEVRLHDTLKELTKERPLPQLTRWIQNAKNLQYKCFLIKEIGYFNQQESAPYLLELFESTEKQAIKGQIAETLGALKYTPAIGSFEREFQFATQSLQDNIIISTGMLQSEEALPFLKEAYLVTHSNETKILIVDAIKQCGRKGEDMLHQLSLSSSTDFEKRIFATMFGSLQGNVA